MPSVAAVVGFLKASFWSVAAAKAAVFSVAVWGVNEIFRRLRNPRRGAGTTDYRSIVLSAVAPARWILGEARVSGVLAYFGSRGREARLALIVSEGRCEGVRERMWIDGEAVALVRTADSGGDILRPAGSSKFHGNVEVREYFLGDGTQGSAMRAASSVPSTAEFSGPGQSGWSDDPTDVTERWRDRASGGTPAGPDQEWRTDFPEWTADHRLEGMSWLYVTLTQPPATEDMPRFWSRVPRLEFLIRGIHVKHPDPALSIGDKTEWTANAGALRFWWETVRRGRDPARIDRASVVSAIQASDQVVMPRGIVEARFSRMVVDSPASFSGSPHGAWALDEKGSGSDAINEFPDSALTAPPTDTSSIIEILLSKSDATGSPISMSGARPGTTIWLRSGSTTYFFRIRGLGVRDVATHFLIRIRFSHRSGSAIADPFREGETRDLTIGWTGGSLKSGSGYGASFPRYQVNGIVDSDDGVRDVEAQLDFAWAGSVIETSGTLKFRPGASRPIASQSIAETDLVESPTVVAWPTLQDRINAVDCQIDQSSAHDWTRLSLPRHRDEEAFARDGEERADTLTCRFVSDPVAAGLLQAILLRRSRESMRLEVSLQPGGSLERLSLAPLDVVSVSLPSLGLDAVDCEVQSMTVRSDLSVGAVLSEIRAGTYDASLVVPPLLPRRIRLPDATTVPDVTGLSLGADLEQLPDGTTTAWLLVTWNRSPAVSTEVEIRENGGSVWSSSVSAGRHIRLGPLSQDVDWEVHARHWSSVGVAGAWTAIHTLALASDTTVPGPLSDLGSYGGLGRLSVFWTLPADTDVRDVAYYLDTSDSLPATPTGYVDGTQIQIPNLTAETYYFWGRARDRSGNLGPVSSPLETVVLAPPEEPDVTAPDAPRVQAVAGGYAVGFYSVICAIELSSAAGLGAVEYSEVMIARSLDGWDSADAWDPDERAVARRVGPPVVSHTEFFSAGGTFYVSARVWSRPGAAYSPWSQPVSVVTSEVESDDALPGAPGLVVGQGRGQAIATITRPIDDWLTIYAYEIQVTENSAFPKIEALTTRFDRSGVGSRGRVLIDVGGRRIERVSGFDWSAGNSVSLVGQVVYLHRGIDVNLGTVVFPLSGVVESVGNRQLTVRAPTTWRLPPDVSSPPSAHDRTVQAIVGGDWISAPEDLALNPIIEITSGGPPTIEHSMRISDTSLVRVRAWGQWGYGPWSTVRTVSLTSDTETPVPVVSLSRTGLAVVATWPAISVANRYEGQKSEDGGSSWGDWTTVTSPWSLGTGQHGAVWCARVRVVENRDLEYAVPIGAPGTATPAQATWSKSASRPTVDHHLLTRDVDAHLAVLELSARSTTAIFALHLTDRSGGAYSPGGVTLTVAASSIWWTLTAGTISVRFPGPRLSGVTWGGGDSTNPYAWSTRNAVAIAAIRQFLVDYSSLSVSDQNSAVLGIVLASTEVLGNSGRDCIRLPDQAAAVPGPVVRISCTPSDTQLRITWGPPASGGSPTVYLSRFREDSGTWSAPTETSVTRVFGGSSSTWFRTIPTLTPGTLHEVEVWAKNASGNGATSSVKCTTTGTAPPPPVVLVAPGPVTGLACTPALTSLGLAWVAPTTGGAVAAYEGRIKIGNGVVGSWVTLANAPSITDDWAGLDYGTAHTVDVRATNTSGPGTAGSVTCTTLGLPSPGAVTGLKCTPQRAQDDDGEWEFSADLSWKAPKDLAEVHYSLATWAYFLSSSEDSGTTWSGWSQLGSKTTLSLEDLTQGQEYRWRVRAAWVEESGAGPTASVTCTMLDIPLPDPPGAISVLICDESPTVVDVAFTPPASGGAVATYQYRHREVVAEPLIQPDWTLYWDETSDDTAEVTVTGLTAETEYEVEIRAANRGGTGVSSIISCTTSAAPVIPTGPPGAVRKLKCTALLYSSVYPRIEFTWNPPTTGGLVTGYRWFNPSIGPSGKEFPISKSVSKVILYATGYYSTSYTVWIQAIGSDGNGPKTSVTCTTPADPKAVLAQPGAVTDLACAPTQGSLGLTWTAPASGGAVATYWGRIKKNSGSYGSWVKITDGATSYRWPSLLAATSYSVQVQGRNSAGDGTADTVTCTTKTEAPPVVVTKPGAVTNLECTPGFDRLDLAWTAPTTGSAVTAYERRWGPWSLRSGTQYGEWAEFSGEVKSTGRISGLTRGRDYTVEVRAKNNAGTGGSSDSVRCRTSGADLTNPTVTIKASSTTNSVTATWTTVAGASGYRTTYNSGVNIGGLRSHAASVRSVTYSGLAWSTRVRVSVWGVDSNGRAGKRSTSTFVTTRSKPVVVEPPPAKPGTPSVTLRSQRSGSGWLMSWSWTAVAGATKYTQQGKVSGQKWGLSSTASSSRTGSVLVLVPGTHCVRIRAHRGETAGDWATDCTETSKISLRAPNLTITRIVGTSSFAVYHVSIPVVSGQTGQIRVGDSGSWVTRTSTNIRLTRPESVKVCARYRKESLYSPSSCETQSY